MKCFVVCCFVVVGACATESGSRSGLMPEESAERSVAGAETTDMPRAVLGTQGAGGVRGDGRLAAVDLLADLEVLERIYRELHPGLYRYHDARSLESLFAEARREMSRERSLTEAFLAFTRLTADLRCGHSYPNFFNQSEEVAAALFRGPRLPFTFRWIDDRMVVTEDLGQVGLPPGTVIESLGGIATSEILAALLPLARADGSNRDKRTSYLEVAANSEFEAFEILLPLRFPGVFADATSVDLEVATAGSVPRSRRVPLQAYSERAALVLAREPSVDGAEPLWQLAEREHRGQRVAYLKMPHWVTYKSKWDWEGFLHATMDKLVHDRIPALVVDLRGNEGGTDAGDPILAHIVEERVPSRTTVRRVRFQRVPEDLRPGLDTWDPSFFTLGEGSTSVGDGFWELAPREDGGDFITPRGPRFGGRLVVLIDASNSSATFQFAATVQRQRLGKLVGVSTGGSQRGINGGAFFFARLPRTGLEVDVPLIGTFPPGPPSVANEAPDSGIVPDFVVAVTAADLAAGRDRQLEVALDVALGTR